MGVATRHLRHRAIAVALAAIAIGSVPLAAGAQETTTSTTTTTTTSPATTTTTTSPGTTTTTVETTTTSGPTSTSTTATTVAGATPAPAVDQSALAGLLQDYDGAVALENDLLAAYDLTVAELNALTSELAGLSESVTTVQLQLLSAQTRLTEAEQLENVAAIKLLGLSAELAEAQERIEDQAVTAYIYGGSEPSLVAAMMDSESIKDLETSREYASAVAEATDDEIEEFGELKDEAARLRADAEEARTAAEEARDEVADRRAQLEADRERQVTAQLGSFTTALAQQELIAQAQSRRGDYELRLRTLQGTSDSITEILRKRQEGQSLPDDQTEIFINPVQNGRIASPFGARVHPIYGTIRMHNGFDIPGAAGSPLRASGDGVVVVAELQEGYGNVIVVDHGNGLATLYAHNASLIAKVGDRVKMGEVIALVGSTGYSTGPHSHWEVRVYGIPTDPMPFMGTDQLLLDRLLQGD